MKVVFCNRRKNNQVELTDNGIKYLSGDTDADFLFYQTLELKSLTSKRKKLDKDAEEEEKEVLFQDFSIKSERIHTLTQLLKAYFIRKDVEYVIMDNKIMIVDEQTGRIMDGRRYSDGLHQAIEAKT
jgi:preprotein translocase subunit SecA